MTPLRHACFALLLLTVIVASTGCLVEQHDLQIAEDGSADLTIHYGMPDRTIETLQAAQTTVESLPTDPTGRPATPFKNPYSFKESVITNWFSPSTTPGVALTKLSFDKRSGWTYTTLTIHFDSLKAIEALSDHPALANHRYNMKTDTNGTHQLTHVFNHHSPKASVDMSDRETRKNLTPMLAGLHVSVDITVPGVITKHNAHGHVPRTVSWDYSFDKHPKAVEHLETDIRRVIFTSPGKLNDFDLTHSETPSRTAPTSPDR